MPLFPVIMNDHHQMKCAIGWPIFVHAHHPCCSHKCEFVKVCYIPFFKNTFCKMLVSGTQNVFVGDQSTEQLFLNGTLIFQSKK